MPNLKTKSVALFVSVLCLSLIIAYVALAWTEPSSNPPGGNVASPINTGPNAQSKVGPLSATQFGGSLGVGYLNPDGNSFLNGNLSIKSGGYLDDDTSFGGKSDDWLRFRGFIEIRSNTDSYGIVLRDKDVDSNDYMNITQVNGSSYLSDSRTASNYFLKGDYIDATIGRNLFIRGGLSTYDTTVSDNTVEASQFCLGNGTNCITTWSTGGWIKSGTYLYNLSNRIGIGTATPDAKLNVGESGGSTILITREDTSTRTNNLLGRLLFDSIDGGVSSVDASAVIEAYATENHGSGDKGGRMIFKVKKINVNGNQVATQMMEINGDGVRMILENRTTNPPSPRVGQMWICTDSGGDC